MDPTEVDILTIKSFLEKIVMMFKCFVSYRVDYQLKTGGTLWLNENVFCTNSSFNSSFTIKKEF